MFIAQYFTPYSRSLACVHTDDFSPSQIGEQRATMSAARTLSYSAGQSSRAQPLLGRSGHDRSSASGSLVYAQSPAAAFRATQDRSVAKALATQQRRHGLAQDGKVVSQKGKPTRVPATLDVIKVKRFETCVRPFRDLRLARPPRSHVQPILDAALDLPCDERRWPRAGADEAHLATEDVDELRQLVEVPRLEHAPAGPGEIHGIRFENTRVATGLVHPTESFLLERAQLEQIELTTLRDAPLAIEEATAIAPTDDHVNGHRGRSYGPDRQRNEQERARNHDVLGTLRTRDSDISCGDVASQIQRAARKRPADPTQAPQAMP